MSGTTEIQSAVNLHVRDHRDTVCTSKPPRPMGKRVHAGDHRVTVCSEPPWVGESGTTEIQSAVKTSMGKSQGPRRYSHPSWLRESGATQILSVSHKLSFMWKCFVSIPVLPEDTVCLKIYTKTVCEEGQQGVQFPVINLWLA